MPVYVCMCVCVLVWTCVSPYVCEYVCMCVWYGMVSMYEHTSGVGITVDEDVRIIESNNAKNILRRKPLSY